MGKRGKSSEEGVFTRKKTYGHLPLPGCFGDGPRSFLEETPRRGSKKRRKNRKVVVIGLAPILEEGLAGFWRGLWGGGGGKGIMVLWGGASVADCEKDVIVRGS